MSERKKEKHWEQLKAATSEKGVVSCDLEVKYLVSKDNFLLLLLLLIL